MIVAGVVVKRPLNPKTCRVVFTVQLRHYHSKCQNMKKNNRALIAYYMLEPLKDSSISWSPYKGTAMSRVVSWLGNLRFIT